MDKGGDGSIYPTPLINKTFAKMSRLILFTPAAMGSLNLSLEHILFRALAMTTLLRINENGNHI